MGRDRNPGRQWARSGSSRSPGRSGFWMRAGDWRRPIAEFSFRATMNTMASTASSSPSKGRAPQNWTVEVVISRWVSDEHPGWVECELTDAHGKIWRFEEKAPIVSDRLITPESLPCSGSIGCALVGNAEGRAITVIDTSRPWGIASVDGRSLFTVKTSQLSRAD